jgi:hypothetical protein
MGKGGRKGTKERSEGEEKLRRRKWNRKGKEWKENQKQENDQYHSNIVTRIVAVTKRQKTSVITRVLYLTEFTTRSRFH